jgi:hypothetical protein
MKLEWDREGLSGSDISQEIVDKVSNGMSN